MKKHINLSDTSYRNLLKFALPLIATSFLQQLFNSADSAVVGRFVGAQALAAVGGNAPTISLLINLFNGIAIGANVVVARYLGEKNQKKVSDAVLSLMVLSLFCGVFVAILGNFVSRPLLTIIKTPDDTIDLAVTYLKIYFYGMPFAMIFNFGNAILRSYGETDKPLIALFFSGIVNILLNLLFVIKFNMSVVGVGFATLISNAVCAVIVLYVLINRDDCLKLKFKNANIDIQTIIFTLKVGLPAGLQGTVFSISNVVILSAVNSFGSKALAGATAATMFENFSYFITQGFNNTAVSFVSHNYGAKDLNKCRRAYYNNLVLAAVGEFLFDLIVVLLRYPLLKIFNSDLQVISFGVQKLLIVTGLHFMISFYEISGGSLRGYGKSLIPALITLVCCCGIRIFWIIFILPLHRTFTFMFLAYPISWLFCGIAVTSAYNIVYKKLK